MVPVTFSGFWGGYGSGWGEVREGVAHKKISIGHEKEGRGATIGSPPLPYEIRIRNPHWQKRQAHIFLESF